MGHIKETLYYFVVLVTEK